MKKIAIVSIGAMFFLSLFAFPAFSQRAWKYTRISGIGGLSKSSLPTSLPMQSTPSNYPNITLHPDANVDQSEMSISTAPANTFNVLAGANAVVQNVNPVSYNQGYYYSTTEGGNWAGSDTLPTDVIYTSDPAVSYDVSGNAFFSFLKYTTGWTLAVKKSTNGGTSWGSDVTLPSTGSPDKEHMAIDVNPSSPYTVTFGSDSNALFAYLGDISFFGDEDKEKPR